MSSHRSGDQAPKSNDPRSHRRHSFLSPCLPPCRWAPWSVSSHRSGDRLLSGLPAPRWSPWYSFHLQRASHTDCKTSMQRCRPQCRSLPSRGYGSACDPVLPLHGSRCNRRWRSFLPPRPLPCRWEPWSVSSHRSCGQVPVSHGSRCNRRWRRFFPPRLPPCWWEPWSVSIRRSCGPVLPLHGSRSHRRHSFLSPRLLPCR